MHRNWHFYNIPAVKMRLWSRERPRQNRTMLSNMWCKVWTDLRTVFILCRPQVTYRTEKWSPLLVTQPVASRNSLSISVSNVAELWGGSLIACPPPPAPPPPQQEVQQTFIWAISNSSISGKLKLAVCCQRLLIQKLLQPEAAQFSQTESAGSQWGCH